MIFLRAIVTIFVVMMIAVVDGKVFHFYTKTVRKIRERRELL